MAHYTGPRARVNRRLGAVIFENAGAMRSMERKPNPPGMAMRARKLSTYGESMREKQKIKYYYGLGERQLRKLFQKAKHTAGNTGENLLILCEMRLDSVIRLAGFAKTRSQARQGVAHGHFLVNGRRTDVASYQVRVGDRIHVKRRANLSELYRGFVENFDGQPADWLTIDNGQQEIIVSRLPGKEDITLPVDVGMVVELLSR